MMLRAESRIFRASRNPNHCGLPSHEFCQAKDTLW